MKYTGKRFIAYVIDIVIVLFISSMFSNINLINPTKDKYEDTYDKYIESLNSDSSSTTSSDDILNLESEYNQINYDLSKYGVYTTIINIVFLFSYFVVFQYYNKGQTIGKKMMKIKVVGENNSRPSFLQMLGRSLIMNDIVKNTVAAILVLTLSKSVYITSSLISEVLFMVVVYSSVGFMLFRKDGKGIHDLLFKTKVISTVKDKEEIKEAKYIEETK